MLFSQPNRQTSTKLHLLIAAAVALVLLAAGFQTMYMTRAYYQNQMALESQRLAQSYTQSLVKAVRSTEIINSLLDDKLAAASRVVARFKPQSDAELGELARMLGVDVIYAYNAQGVVVYSHDGGFIGWTAQPGHPVYAFMTGDKPGLVEAIRPDTETGVLYKYGYFRAGDGSFVQIGVLADKIQDFLGMFEMKVILEEMEQDHYVSFVHFIDNDLQHVPGCEHGELASDLFTINARSAIITDQAYTSTYRSKAGTFFVVMLPVMSEGSKAGTLIMGHDTRETERLINNVSLIGIIALVTMLSLLAAAFLATMRKERVLVEAAYSDTLTGLPNQRAFVEYATAALGRRDIAQRAILLINCRNFKLINMTYGYQYGNEIIRSIAAQLATFQSPTRHLFHISGDRFAFCVSQYGGRNALQLLCSQIINDVRQSLQSHHTGIVIGIVEVGDEAYEPERLMRNAAIAVDQVLPSHSEGSCFFDLSMERRLLREEQIERDLRACIQDQAVADVFLVFQPIIEVKTERIVGFEALARMKSLELGVVSPLEFIAVAEKTQLIVPLGRRITRQACQFLARLNQNGHSDLKVSINISAVQLLRDDFVSDLLLIIAETGVQAARIWIEITESIFADNYGIINDKLQILSEHGIQVAIDDFGTGYSSLARERELNVSCLKIDKYFIDKLSELEPEQALTGDIISMAHRLGHIVIAEGVELECQKAYLIEHACDLMQGYLFSRPLPADEAITRLQ